MSSTLSHYRKFFVGAIGAVLTWAIATYANDPDISKWLGLASAVLTGLGVYQVPNEPMEDV